MISNIHEQRRQTKLASPIEGVTPKRLLIVAKTRIKNGFCVMGYNDLENKFYRPIYGEDCSWPWSTGFQIGKIYDFLTMAENPAAETSLPHRTEDILVSGYCTVTQAREQTMLSNRYRHFCEIAKTTVREIFSPATLQGYNNFIEEGQDCASVGLLRIHNSRLEFVSVLEKTRIMLKDEDEIEYSLPWKSTGGEGISGIQSVDDAQLVPVVPREDYDHVFVLIGLARGWRGEEKTKGNFEFDVPRCYLMALSIL